jgi:hypothetical protein
MTYGRGAFANGRLYLDGAPLSHSAELVRGDLLCARRRPPHPPIVLKARLRHDGYLLPKARRDWVARSVPHDAAKTC